MELATKLGSRLTRDSYARLKWPPDKDIFTVDTLAKRQGFRRQYHYVTYGMQLLTAQYTISVYQFKNHLTGSWDVITKTGKAFASYSQELWNGNDTRSSVLIGASQAAGLVADE